MLAAEPWCPSPARLLPVLMLLLLFAGPVVVVSDNTDDSQDGRGQAGQKEGPGDPAKELGNLISLDSLHESVKELAQAVDKTLTKVGSARVAYAPMRDS